MLKRVLFCCFLISGIAISCYSQSFKWIKQIGDRQSDIDPLCKILPYGQSIIIWSYADSTQIDGVKIKSQKKTLFLVSFLNKDGKLKWTWKPDSCFSVVDPTAISYSESLGKIFVCGNFNKNAIINKVTYKGNTNGFVIRLDTNGTFEKTYILSDTSALIFESMDITSQNEIIIGVQYTNSGSQFKLTIPSVGFSINKRGSFLLKLDKDLNPQKASEPEYGIKNSRFLVSVKPNAEILSITSFEDTLRIGSNFYYDGKKTKSTYITYWDKNLVFKKNLVLFKTLSSSAVNTLKYFTNGDILIAGYYRDSISLISKKYANANLIALFACLDSNLNLKWAKVPDIKTGDRIGAQIMDIDISSDYIIAGGIFDGDAHYDDFHLPDSTGLFWFFKTDNRGNILWMTRCANSISGKYVSSISSNNQKEFLVTGYIIDTVKLNNKQYITPKSRPDVLLMKIHDIEIYRGYVKSGPYCAGDTMKIPYTKDGEFNAGNEFIAQLSDEEGNFTGKERELGRVKSTTDGMIKGKLPLFDVESSPHYRIRILSTNPVVQSYYKYDTLRLLIYSKDKANPGQPETICNGDSIRLSTYGGTKWAWSPKYNMNDSTLKKPWVWPSKTTTYKLIIADSSGCGKPDTAFKKIIVRWPLKVSVVSKDTGVCDSKPIKLPAWFSGGDSLYYQWRWYAVSKSKKIWKQLNTGQLKLSDTLTYTPTATLYTNDTLAIVLKDNCTNKNDTAFIIVRLLKPSVITSKFKDTLVCKGTAINYKATVWFAQTYQWQWRDITNNTILSTTNSLSHIATTTAKIKLTLTNGCTIDSSIFMLNVNRSLSASILTAKGSLNDTTLCSGQSLSLFATGKGGAGKGYIYSWIWNGNIVSKSDTLRLKPTSTSALTLILNDNCTKAADTLSKTITIIETPKADFTWDLACSRTSSNFKYTGSKPIQTFAWNFNNEATSNLENPSHKFAAIGTSITVLAVTSGNGCIDTIKKTIDIKPQSKAAFTTADVCENESAVFINKSQDATSYIWKFGDGLNSNVESPKHLYTIGGVSQTFNVTLVAFVSGGCSDSVVNALTVNSNPISDFRYTTNKNSVDFEATQLGNTIYKWKFGNGDSATSSSNNYTYTYSKLSGKYTACLKAINTANCFSETCKTINISVGVSPLSKPTGFKIFPNPNNGSFTVEMENPEMDAAIEVFDVMGKLVRSVERVGKVTLVDMDVASGIYLVKVRNGEEVWMRKILVSFGVDTNR
jgi:hypothetical protein